MITNVRRKVETLTRDDYSFWGIFWIDASNGANAGESWKKVARLGGREGRVEAGKHWLSDHSNPWLLIIDSSDASDDPLESHFPVGDWDCIVITIRNSKPRIISTVGPVSLDRLEENEAHDLLERRHSRSCGTSPSTYAQRSLQGTWGTYL